MRFRAVVPWGVLVLVLLACPSVQAREFTSPPPGGGLVENSDGTWSFYTEHGVTPARTYTSAEHEVMRRLGAGLELDTGTTEQTASVVSGIGSLEIVEDEALANRLRTGELYKSSSEEQIGDGLIAVDEGAATLPGKARVLAAMASVKAEGVGAFRVGDGIGAGIGELFAFPPVPGNFRVMAYSVPERDKESYRNVYYKYLYTPEIGAFVRHGGTETCQEIGEAWAPSSFFTSLKGYGFSPSDDCEWGTASYYKWEAFEVYRCSPGCGWVKEESEPVLSKEFTGGGAWPPFVQCPGDWLPCWHQLDEGGDESLGVYVDDGEAVPAAFPAPKVEALKTAWEREESGVAHQPALSVPVAPAEPRIGPTKYVEFLLYEATVLLPGIEGPGIHNPYLAPRASETWGAGGTAEPDRHSCYAGKPVNCSNGNEVAAQTDLVVGGRGPGMTLTRTYNSQLAASQTLPGPFGYGWTGSYSAHLEITSEGKEAIVYQDDGSTVAFTRSGESWTPAGVLVQAALAGEGSGYVYTLPNQLKLRFSASGQLTGEEDRNGNTLSMSYNSKGQLETVSDLAGRKITFTYDSEGQVEQASDPMGHTVKYTYEHGALATVIEPGETSARWVFKYNTSHELTSLTDGRGNTMSMEYNSQSQVISQTDPMHRTRKWSYSANEDVAGETTMTEPNGSTTVEQFNTAGEPTSVTRAAGTSIASETTYEYSGAQELTAVVDPDGHKTEYGYDSSGNRISEKNADGDETKWTYDSTHDVETETTPEGETTTIKRNGHGDPEAIERSVGGETQKTTYKYASNGDVESMTNPLEQTWKYEYDSYGDRKSETDPEGNKRTWEYNGDSQEIAAVSPRGNVGGGEPAVYTTTIERDAQGRPLTETAPPREAAYGFAFGSKGSGNGQFEFPTLEVMTPSGDIWVSDSSLDRLQEFNEKGEYQTQFGTKGTGVKEFKFPFGIAINPSNGNIYVSDYENSRVQEFSSSGAFIRMFGYGVSNGKAEFEICTEKCQAGLKGAGTSGQFGRPVGVTIDASGNVWVADEVDNRLDEFKENGEFIKEFGVEGKEAGKIKQPVGLAYDNGNLYVTEAANQRVQEFSTAGSSVRTFGSEGTGNGQFKIPYAITAGPTSGVLYVTDRENDRVQEFTATGHFLSSFGSKGKGNGQFELPTGVAASASEDLYVSDHNNQRVQEWTGPSPRITKYAYDANGNLETLTDPNGNKTKYVYDADNELTKIEEPQGTATESEYNSMGQIKSETDGNKHITKYERNLLGEVTEVIDPKERKTTKEYDAAGNLKSMTDAAKRTTTYTYDPANRLENISYSDGKTHTVEYEYSKDGKLTKMIDGSGTTKYTYDKLDRLTETENGHKEVTRYAYNLVNESTKITYPNGKEVTRTYDKDARLEKVTDWNSQATKFTYNEDSELKATMFPGETKDEDTYAYNDADQMTEVKMLKSTETLASLLYTRDGDGQVATVTSKGLPGEEKPSYEYDKNNRLTKGAGIAYEYDAANNPTKLGSTTYKYDSADQLESGGSTKYAYNEVGERTKTTPETGSATAYGYDQAGNITSVERPKEGEKAAIEDTYTYSGEGLRISETTGGGTNYLAWDNAETGVPLLLSNGSYSFIYGPGGVPFEQINNTTGAVLYLHHDQAGSTRLLTGSTGKVEGSYTYSAYGTPEHSGTATTPLGYDAQYTSSDTGLIYMRARVYDPATAQFLSRDPLAAITGEPYSYTGDNPLNRSDPTGLLFGVELPSLEEIGEGIAGWGDTITFGGTEWVREQLGDNNIDVCSGAYQGGGIAGLVTGVLIPGEGEAEIGAEGISISAKIARQMETRGWTEESIQEAMDSGKQVRAVNKATGNPATRYINPTTGQSVVVDDVTGEVVHVGRQGMQYGPGSGDLP
jgi:RHS repeat-associated protein